MKRAVLLLLIPLFISCTKEPPDFRDQFAGNYRCSYLKTEHHYYQDSMWTFPIHFSTDTRISIGKTEAEHEITFLDWNLTINEDGEIESGYCIVPDCIDCRDYYIKFEDNRIEFFEQCGSQVTFYRYELTGIKIE